MRQIYMTSLNYVEMKKKGIHHSYFKYLTPLKFFLSKTHYVSSQLRSHIVDSSALYCSSKGNKWVAKRLANNKHIK